MRRRAEAAGRREPGDEGVGVALPLLQGDALDAKRSEGERGRRRRRRIAAAAAAFGALVSALALLLITERGQGLEHLVAPPCLPLVGGAEVDDEREVEAPGRSRGTSRGGSARSGGARAGERSRCRRRRLCFSSSSSSSSCCCCCCYCERRRRAEEPSGSYQEGIAGAREVAAVGEAQGGEPGVGRERFPFFLFSPLALLLVAVVVCLFVGRERRAKSSASQSRRPPLSVPAPGRQERGREELGEDEVGEPSEERGENKVKRRKRKRSGSTTLERSIVIDIAAPVQFDSVRASSLLASALSDRSLRGAHRSRRQREKLMIKERVFAGHLRIESSQELFFLFFQNEFFKKKRGGN